MATCEHDGNINAAAHMHPVPYIKFLLDKLYVSDIG
jgi:hypothetical protein